jgi:pimeloyl-ACP methyl ester carboxylesterase
MVYLIPGLGADHRVFESLVLPGFETQILVWEHPNKYEPIADYTKRLLPQMKEKPTAIIGLSFGGVIAAEMRSHFPEAKIILISSIGSRREFPWWARLGGTLRLNRIFSGKFLKHRNPIVRWIFGVNPGHDTELFNAILRDSDPDFLYWAFDVILNWKGNATHRVHHIHGSKDRLLPMSCTSADTCVNGGGHFMIVSHGKELSAILTQILRKLKAV